MENISNYLSFCSKMLGVEASDCFQTVDLYEKQNMDNVRCFISLQVVIILFT